MLRIAALRMLVQMRTLQKCALMATMVVTLSLAGQEWTPVAPGVAHRELRAVVGRDTVHLHALRLNTNQVQLKIVHLYSFLEQRPGSYAYSLSDVAKRAGPIAAINGGFSTSFSLPTPDGLLRVDGVDYASLNTINETLSGVVCVSNRGAVSIIRRVDYNDDICRHALQAGPLLIEPDGRLGIRGVTSRAQTRTARSAICINRSNEVILVTSGAASLYALSVVLNDRRTSMGLSCRVALNLAGDSEAGLVFQTGRQVIWIGSRQSSIASAILVTPNRL